METSEDRRKIRGKVEGRTASTPSSLLRHIYLAAELLNRVSSLRTKALTLNKQANAYEKAAELITDDDGEPLFEDNAAKLGMTYIGEVLPLSRKDLDK